MHLRHALAFVVLAFSATVATPSPADWSKTESFEFSAKTSIKITDPAGAKAYVTIGNEVKEEALPAVFALPDADAFIAVKVVAADGDTWTGKVEVKAKKQTVLKLNYVPKAAGAKPSGAKFMGQMQNWTHQCDRRERDVLKFVAMKDGKAAYETTLRPNQAATNVELEPGQYSVRIFKGANFVRALDLQVDKDGWVFKYGCF